MIRHIKNTDLDYCTLKLIDMMGHKNGSEYADALIPIHAETIKAIVAMAYDHDHSICHVDSEDFAAIWLEYNNIALLWDSVKDQTSIYYNIKTEEQYLQLLNETSFVIFDDF